MEGTRKKQTRTLLIIFIAVVALTIGFSAFSSSLLIKTRISVNPDNGTFNVKFSNSSDRLDESQVVPTKSSNIFTAYNGVIDNSGIPTIENLGGEFTQPGETITYDFYTLNTGSTKAYLTDVIFNNVDGESVNKKCTSLEESDQTAVDEACKSISIKVIMGTDKITGTRKLVGHDLDPNESEPVRVVIEYKEGAVLPEVEFEVELGTISMIYNTLEGEGESEQPSESVEYTFTPPLPNTCYLSLEEGMINAYNPNATDCSTPGLLPTQLQVTPLTATFSQAKCEAYLDALSENFDLTTEEVRPSGDVVTLRDVLEDPSNYCSDLESDMESFFLDPDYYYLPIGAYLGNDLVEEYEDDLDDEIDDTAVSFASMDIQFGEPTGTSHNITSIAFGAFAMKELSSVTFPSTLTSIGPFAFVGNGLTSVEIPASVTIIEGGAFAYITDLSSVTIHKTFSNLTSEEKTNLYQDGQFIGYSGNIIWDTNDPHSLSE